MTKILVSGLINIENTLQIEKFPIDYFPVCYPFFGVSSSVSGVGFNVASALNYLGDEVKFVSMLGKDFLGKSARSFLKSTGIDDRFISPCLKETPQSVILYDKSGKRQIHVDLKNIQETEYPEGNFEKAAKRIELAVLCNINFSRKFLPLIKQRNIPIACDVHAISSIEDKYNLDFMSYADILFCSDELLPCSPENWSEQVINRYGKKIVIVGCGAKGAWLTDPNCDKRLMIPAIYTRPIVNTIGAGDALFSSFIHFFAKTNDSENSLKKAILFASYKIGEKGAAAGFLSEKQLAKLAKCHKS
ncbi:MAG: carbohydrate kinase family protein [Candidatus Riflebacteria bacterium]|nr:carbohydrate kinase family protein [Candidatus Riflebacteria bacterium]